ncbi:hypothetical protein [Brachyspira sp. SAP_772]|uniref:hypothetical protein n=1 Tax=Brachyspira sp. SAP_772 TaxID=2608385 RepID=UPI0012F4DB3C|nr:hypothetical protein [Brachyspira sp. SAP_772]
MSKKIIYLLFLLMALTLAFASCKKDNGLNPTTGFNNPIIPSVTNSIKDEDKNVQTNTGGLYEDWDSIKDLTVIENYAAIDKARAGTNYYRNPIVVALGYKTVMIIFESRMGFGGSENGTGVNGKDPVALAYTIGVNSGDPNDFYKIAQPSSFQTGPEYYVSDFVVYYQKLPTSDTATLYIIASSGAGLSRTNTPYASRTIKSKLRYMACTITTSPTSADFRWNDDWTDLEITDSSLSDIQFGTHSARGVIASDGSLILPIITADLGTTSEPKENMGVRFYKVNANGRTLTLGSQIGRSIEFKDSSNYKEVQAVAYDASKVTYLAIPNSSRNNYTMGKGTSANSTVTALTGVKGSDGSFGFLKISKGWYGTNQYDPKLYVTSPSTAGSKAEDTILFSHTESKLGANYLYMLNDYYTSKGKSILQIGETSKSSSIDVLADGTIIMASERDGEETANGLKFSIYFSRYTQKYLAEQLK